MDIDGVDTNMVDIDLKQLIGVVLKHTQGNEDDEVKRQQRSESHG